MEDYMEKLIPNFSAYKINNQGEVYSRWVCLRAVKPRKFTLGNQWKIIKPVYDKSCGYMIVTLIDDNGKRFNKRIHRLLMEAFVPNPQGFKHINHIDGNKLNNSLSNLEWCTCKHNTNEAIRLGLFKPKLQASNRAVQQLDDNYNVINEFISIHAAEDITGICYQNIYKVCKGLRPKAGGYRWQYK